MDCCRGIGAFPRHAAPSLLRTTTGSPSMTTKDLVDFLPYILLAAILLGTTGFGWYVLKPRNYHSFRSVAILVLGDVGRSPRMMYHAQSFAENGFVTDIVGYKGAQGKHPGVVSDAKALTRRI